MSSRDDAVKVGADALLQRRKRVPPSEDAVLTKNDSGTVLDAAHDAGLIVWADELEEARRLLRQKRDTS